jgi:ketosteroid isomerase-like protein
MFDARERGDVRCVLSLMHPDIVATTIADGRTLRGIEEVGAYFTDLDASGQRIEVSARRLIVDGERVHVIGRIRTIASGRLVDSPAAWTFAVSGGLVVRVAPAPCA